MQHAITILEVLAVLAVLFVAAVVATRGGPVLAEAPPDDADLDLPVGQLQPEDIRRVRFSMVARGYRMREVDQVLERVAAELAARDARLLALEQALVEVVEPDVEHAEELLTAPAEQLLDEPLPDEPPLDEPLSAPPLELALPMLAEDAAPEPEPEPARPAPPWSSQPAQPALWPQPDLEPEPEPLPSPIAEQPTEPTEPTAQPVHEPLPSSTGPVSWSITGPPPVDDSAFSADLSDLEEDGFPEVQRADDAPQ